MFLEVLKMIKKLLAQGYATKEEKEELNEKVDELEKEEQETVKEDAEKVEGLPEEKPEEEAEGEDEVEKTIKSLIKDTAKEAVEGVKKDVQKWMGEQKSLMEKQAGIYNPAIADKRKALNDRVRSFFRALAHNDFKTLEEMQKLNPFHKKELTTDDTGSPYGGYLVDSELSAEIRHLITEYGVARREMTALQLSKNSYKANNLVTDVTVNWEDEAGAINSTQFVSGQTPLELKKLATIVTMTSELLEDSEIDIAAFVSGRVAEKMAEKEDIAFFKGDGTSTYGSFTGLLNNTSVNEVTMAGTTFASIDGDDLIDMVDATPAGALANAKFYYHRTIKSLIRKLKDDENAYIYQRPSESGPATVWGYPEVLVEAMPSKTDTAAETSFVLFGDLKKACILGYKGAIRAKMFDAGVVRNVSDNADINLITTDREAIRFTERVGYIVILPTAVTKLTTAEASA